LVRPVTEPGVESVDIYFPGGEDEVWVSDSDVQTGSGSVSVPVTSQSVRNRVTRYQNLGICYVVDPILLQTWWCYSPKRYSEV
jgi:hypothetical protein